MRVDVGFWEDPKVLQVNDRARDLYLVALAYTVRNLTDGVVPRQAVRTLAAKSTQDPRTVTATAARLVAVGLWQECREGWRFPPETWRRYQRTKEQVERRRAKDRSRKRKPPDDDDSAVESDAESDAESALDSTPHLTSPDVCLPIPRIDQHVRERPADGSMHRIVADLAARFTLRDPEQGWTR